MALIYALNGLAYFAVALISFYAYYGFCKKEKSICKIGKIFGFNGLIYFLIAFMNLFWAFGFLEANSGDFALVKASVTVISSLLLLYAVYKITDNRNLVYMIVLYITIVFAINFSLKAFFIGTLGASFLLMLMVFIKLAFFSNFYLRLAGYAGAFYSIASIITLIPVYLGYDAGKMPWFLAAALLFFAILFIYIDVTELGIIKNEKLKKKSRVMALAYLGVLVKFLVFIMSVSAFVLVSTVAMHELGHALAAQYYGCGHYKAVIYDIIAPHTEIRCDRQYNDVVLTLAGLLSTIAVALLFRLTGSQFTKDISYLILGFGLLIAYGDLVELKISKNLIALEVLLSLIVIIAAIVKTSFYYLKDEAIFKHEAEMQAHENKKVLKPEA